MRLHGEKNGTSLWLSWKPSFNQFYLLINSHVWNWKQMWTFNAGNERLKKYTKWIAWNEVYSYGSYREWPLFETIKSLTNNQIYAWILWEFQQTILMQQKANTEFFLLFSRKKHEMHQIFSSFIGWLIELKINERQKRKHFALNLAWINPLKGQTTSHFQQLISM